MLGLLRCAWKMDHCTGSMPRTQSSLQGKNRGFHERVYNSTIVKESPAL